MNGAEWDGIDRRTAHEFSKFSSLMKEHVVEEMDRYDQILHKINMTTLASEKRHDDTHDRIDGLTSTITQFMTEQAGFISAIKKAFPKDDDGHPDYDGHRSAHLSWIKDSAEEKEFKSYVKKVVTGAVAIALLSWLASVIWPAFLMGPHK